MRNLRKGSDPNILELLVPEVQIKSDVHVQRGMIEEAIYLKIFGYNLDNLLCQILEEYGEEEIIKRIKEL